MQQPKASPTRPTMHEGSITHSLPKGWREGEREREGHSNTALLGRMFSARKHAILFASAAAAVVVSGDDDRDWLQFPEGTGYGPCG